ncbi:cheBR, two-component system, chemotaxis family, CheB/CheR fusion protein (plasmid) [Nostoc flagelliforme CCNUN1]|uniref:CheBR, two-component system, chemotaxis family, CheB/CheR fusion protein n=1 Tax=Nostoc flagelliforme CCNUN1 TaxID=2038116 RepID=A0A2K8TBP7_9NOSO|nr:chemotaxis protein CheB [Nostoc flagelliforme]AUB45003.1 cheBR, two-component system, chemotaxis family, CheB/CheR fusion protein [Nostoc flagelliforme CCNUN1]
MTSDQPFEQPASESTANDAFDVEQQDIADALFPIVGIAASAGGLEAFTQLLKHLLTDTGMAFVLIQHLDPNHKSLLSEILGRTTTMPVNEVRDGVTVEPNSVYVIPPNTKMMLSGGVLQLTPREKVHGKYMPGDAFFTSLAADRGHKAIAVVLSGADGDGSLGLKAIKATGGVTFAQCENTAEFDSMPNTAVATGNVDFVLPPQKIAEELANLSRNTFISGSLPAIGVEKLPEQGDALATIFVLLRSQTGVDFSHYKPNTLERRIQRRMLLYKLERLEDYAEYLQNNPSEVKALYEEILIHVTHFFRVPEAFELLKERVFPTIIQNKSALPIRIWVAGCSTGEEVYSIAISLLEFLSDKVTSRPIQIFATDISEIAIEKARSGIYAENQMVEVSPESRRFFNALEGGGYQISKAVRELCVFARQDLGSDPPFSNLDLISCRNVLIYLGETLQKRILPIFHYSLNPTGFLLLGTSESTGKYSDLFTLIDKKYKIYSKKLTGIRPTFSFITSNYPIEKVEEPKRINENLSDELDLEKKTDQLILNRYAPVGVVINDKMDVLQFRGEIDLYLKLAPGKPSLNLFKMVRQGLLIELRATIYQAQRQKILVRREGLRIESGDLSKIINLEVIPFKLATNEELYFLVLFEQAPPTVNNVNTVNPESLEQPDLERENVRLKQEIATAIQERAATQEYLQAVIQEQEHINQDLKVANEEILSSNEELQSTNEELETAKEEIQATNEELNTTNEELRSRNQELHQVNNDLTNLLASINIPILILTLDLRVRRFTPMAQRLFNLIPADAGRPLSNIRANLDVPDLETLILEVQDTLSVKELEVQTLEGYWYNLRIRPYRTTENKIDGVVLVLVDIDGLKRSAATLEQARNYAEAIVETVQVPLIVLDSDFRVNKANRSFYETFHVSPSETAQSLVFELGNGQWNLPGLRSLLEDILANDTTIENWEVEHRFERIGKKTMLLNGWKIIQQGDAQRILLAIEDISESKQFELERSNLLAQEQSARQQAEIANRAKDEFLSNLSHELRNPLNTILGWAQLFRTRNLDSSAVTRAWNVVERSAKVQAQLIDDMLDISRVTSGKLHLKTRLIDLVSVVNAAIESIEFSAEAKSIEIVSDLNSVTVVGDEDRLQQVLWNLLSNAIKFTPAGGRVEIMLEAVSTHAQVRVSDTGIGIREDLLPYIFDRFRQGDSSSSKTSHGLGLGLSIVRHLVELHGGTVEAQSPGEGLGTTITVRLPLRSMPLEITPPTYLEPSVLSETLDTLNVQNPPLTLEGLCILAVDDQADSRDLIKWMLSDFGAEIVVVTSVREAIAALTESPGRYDVLLADIGMPEEDGFSLIRQVRALEALAGGQIPAAAITAYATEQEGQKAIDAGFQMHLAKPIELTELVFMVANLTGRITDNS